MRTVSRQHSRSLVCGGIASALLLVGVQAVSSDDAESICTREERRAALGALQEQVLAIAPRTLESLDRAIAPGGALTGWRLSHGHVALAGGPAVGIDNIHTKFPIPQLLLYAPSESSAPSEWLDFAGEDGPYRLVGFAYIAPYAPGSRAPEFECIDREEWFVHEAGWHLTDGRMHLTPGAEVEPARPNLTTGILFWHPRAWDVHLWLGNDGVPTVSFENPRNRGGGLQLPEKAFFYLTQGSKRYVQLDKN